MEGAFDHSALARARLAVLSGHLAAVSAAGGGASPLERSPVSVQEIPPPPRNLGGSLAVIDGRSGKKFEFKISDEGTVRATDFKKVKVASFDLFLDVNWEMSLRCWFNVIGTPVFGCRCLINDELSLCDLS